MTGFIIGTRDSDHVAVEITGRPYSDEWLSVDIEVVARPFSGSYPAMWHAGFLASFRKSLEELYETLEGSAEFTPDWENSLVLSFVGDGLGHFTITGTARPEVGRPDAPVLRFGMPSVDQTELPRLIDEFRAVESDYPPA